MSHEVTNDADYQAYLEANKNGEFAGLQPGTLIAVMNGVILGNAPDFETLYQQDFMQNRTGEILVQPLDKEIPTRAIRRGPMLATNPRH